MLTQFKGIYKDTEVSHDFAYGKMCVDDIIRLLNAITCVDVVLKSDAKHKTTTFQFDMLMLLRFNYYVSIT